MQNLFISPEHNNHELGWMLYENQGLLAQMLTDWSEKVLLEMYKDAEYERKHFSHSQYPDKLIRDTLVVNQFQKYTIRTSKYTIGFQFIHDRLVNPFYHYLTFKVMNKDV